ncbi:hypothetical protein ASF96_00800 [Microbacterium sp. Leaf179]|nr:hypothetical protein ASF96_00800 [Microbacterium sp. Leaf179]
MANVVANMPVQSTTRSKPRTTSATSSGFADSAPRVVTSHQGEALSIKTFSPDVLVYPTMCAGNT